MKNRLLVVGAMIALFASTLVGCASPIERGTVTEKTHRASYTWIQMVCAGYNSQGVCTTQIPVVHTEPDRWSFSLEEGEKTGWVYVSEGIFGEYEVGDYYPRGVR